MDHYAACSWKKWHTHTDFCFCYLLGLIPGGLTNPATCLTQTLKQHIRWKTVFSIALFGQRLMLSIKKPEPSSGDFCIFIHFAYLATTTIE